MNELMYEPVSTKAQIVAIIGSLTLTVFIVYLIRKGHLKSGYSLLWFLVSGVLMLLSLFTELLNKLSVVIGVEYAPAAFFAVMFTGVILILAHFSVVLSRHERRIKTLVQENALLKGEKDKNE